jgi:hypothetical protein
VYSVMASFLQMQLLGFQEKSTMLTVFAPTDEVIKNRLGSFSEYSRSVDLSPACCALQVSVG